MSDYWIIYDGLGNYWDGAAEQGGGLQPGTRAKWSDTLTPSCRIPLWDFVPAIAPPLYRAVQGTILAVLYNADATIIEGFFVTTSRVANLYLAVLYNRQIFNFAAGGTTEVTSPDAWVNLTLTGTSDWMVPVYSVEVNLPGLTEFPQDYFAFWTPYTTGGGDFWNGVPVHTSPWSLLVMGGFSEFAAAPQSVSAVGGFSEFAAAPQSVSAVGGMLERAATAGSLAIQGGILLRTAANSMLRTGGVTLCGVAPLSLFGGISENAGVWTRETLAAGGFVLRCGLTGSLLTRGGISENAGVWARETLAAGGFVLRCALVGVPSGEFGSWLTCGVPSGGLTGSLLTLGGIILTVAPWLAHGGFSLVLTPDAAVLDPITNGGGFFPAAPGVVLNAATLGVARYDNYPMRSIFPLLIGGKQVMFGISPEGLHRFADQQTDNGYPISARFISGVTNMGVDMRKVLTDAYIECRVQGQFSVTVIYDERESYTCAVDRGVDIQGLHFRRVKLPRGIDGTHIQVVIENQDGADFDLQSLRIIAIPKTRRM